jgi:hypothetical protein
MLHNLWVHPRSMRARSYVCFAPKADNVGDTAQIRFVPKADSCSAAKTIPFDHLIGDHEQCYRHTDAQRPHRVALGPAPRNDDARVQFSFNVTCRNSFTACVAAAVAAAL